MRLLPWALVFFLACSENESLGPLTDGPSSDGRVQLVDDPTAPLEPTAPVLQRNPAPTAAPDWNAISVDVAGTAAGNQVVATAAALQDELRQELQHAESDRAAQEDGTTLEPRLTAMLQDLDDSPAQDGKPDGTDEATADPTSPPETQDGDTSKAALPAVRAYYLEAERFSDIATWTIDTQFIPDMGSPYLIAANNLQPAGEAQTTITLPEAGVYYCWVRTMDWLPDHSPGTFEVRIDTLKVGAVFGNGKSRAWRWYGGQRLALAAGRHVVKVKDLTGHYTRFDAVYLSTLSSPPPNDLEPLLQFKRDLLGLTTVNLGSYDFVVVGGGLAGTLAALQAARLGLTTVLVQDRPVLGGAASVETRVDPRGLKKEGDRKGLYRETGLIEEVKMLVKRLELDTGRVDWSEVLGTLVRAEPTLTLFLNTVITGVTVQAGALTELQGYDVLSGNRVTLRGAYFADCTGDGDLAGFAGATVRIGEERADHRDFGNTMGNSLYFRAERQALPQAFTAPVWIHPFTGDHLWFRRHKPFLPADGGPITGFWWVEWGGTIGILDNDEFIRDELVRMLYGVWDHLKNACTATCNDYHSDFDPKIRLANYGLVWHGLVSGKRESRRIIGDVLLQAEDIRQARLFDDRVAVGGWPIDVHPAEGFFFNTKLHNEWPCTHEYVQPYSIPFGALYSKDLSNLMMAGRNLSATREALGSTRVMVTNATMGQAIGAAASLCKKYGLSPRQVRAQHLGELQQLLLREDALIPGLSNADPSDLALGGIFSASSSKPAIVLNRSNLTLGDTAHPMGVYHKGQVYLAVNKRIDSIFCHLRNASAEARSLTLHLRGEHLPRTTSSRTDLKAVTASVPPGANWVEFKVQTDIAAYEYIWFFLDKHPDLSISLMTNTLDNAYRVSSGDGITFTVYDGFYAVYFSPDGIESWYPQNAANGKRYNIGNHAPNNCGETCTNRLYAWNKWASDPSKSLPQWLEVTLPRSTQVERVELYFESLLEGQENPMPGNPEMIRDYRVQTMVNGAYSTVATIKDNLFRHRSHTFTPVSTTKVRVMIDATHGSNVARIYELRVY